MIDWQLCKGGMVGKGKLRYHIFTPAKVTYLRTERSGRFSNIATFSGEGAVKEAMRVAGEWDRDR